MRSTIFLFFVVSYLHSQNFKWLIPANIPDSFSFVYNPLSCSDVLIIEKDGLKGLINKQGKILIEPKLKYLQVTGDSCLLSGNWPDKKPILFNRYGKNLSDGYDDFNFVGDYIIVKKNGMLGVINSQGKIQVPLIYKTHYATSENLSLKNGDSIKILKNKRRESSSYDFTNTKYGPYLSKCKTYVQNGKYGLLNLKGDTLSGPIYKAFEKIKETNGAYVKFIKKDQLAGVIDNNNNTILPDDYNSINYVKPDRWIVSRNKKKGIVDSHNNIILPIEYEIVSNVGNYFLLKKDSLMELVDLSFKPVEGMKHKEIYTNSDRIFVFHDGGARGFYNSRTGFLFPPSYERLICFNAGICECKKGELYNLISAKDGKELLKEDVYKTQIIGNYLILIKIIDSVQYYALVDTTGKFVMDFQKSKIKDLNGELAYSISEDKTNLTLIEMSTLKQYSFNGPDFVVSGGIIISSESKNNHELIFPKDLILKNGKKYSIVNEAGNFFIVGTSLFKYGIYKNGVECAPPVFDQLQHIYENIFKAKKDGKWGIISVNPDTDLESGGLKQNTKKDFKK